MLMATVGVAAGLVGYFVGGEEFAFASPGPSSGYDHLEAVTIEATSYNESGDFAIYIEDACIYGTCQSELPYGPNIQDEVVLSIAFDIPRNFSLGGNNTFILVTGDFSSPTGMFVLDPQTNLWHAGQVVFGSVNVSYPPSGEAYTLTIGIAIHPGGY